MKERRAEQSHDRFQFVVEHWFMG